MARGATGAGGATGTTVPGGIVVDPQPFVVAAVPHPPWHPPPCPPHRLPLCRQENSAQPEWPWPHPPLQPDVGWLQTGFGHSTFGHGLQTGFGQGWQTGAGFGHGWHTGFGQG
jgi:hypothetical protein